MNLLRDAHCAALLGLGLPHYSNETVAGLIDMTYNSGMQPSLQLYKASRSCTRRTAVLTSQVSSAFMDVIMFIPVSAQEIEMPGQEVERLLSALGIVTKMFLHVAD